MRIGEADGNSDCFDRIGRGRVVRLCGGEADRLKKRFWCRSIQKATVDCGFVRDVRPIRVHWFAAGADGDVGRKPDPISPPFFYLLEIDQDGDH